MEGQQYGGEYYQGEGEQANYAPTGAVRPMVDPEAQGDVDIGQYPEPKESTHKVRGRSDILEMLFTNVSQEFVIVKSFYFFFFSSFGSLFPLMAVYFKQLGMNPGQCGILNGVRPFIEYISAPFWGNLADRYQKGKLMLMGALACWIIFTLPIGFIRSPAASCIVFNKTDYILKVPEEKPVMKRSVDPLDDGGVEFIQSTVRVKRDQPTFTIGKSPYDVDFTVNYDKKKHQDWVSPPFTNIVYRWADVQKVFFLVLLLVLLGEFFSSPAITLADSAVLTLLSDEADMYGKQRMFGSIGWGLSMFFVGIALDHSTAFPSHPCEINAREKNYTICFAVFSVLMGCAICVATQMNFSYDAPPTDDMAMNNVQNGPVADQEPDKPQGTGAYGLTTYTDQQKMQAEQERREAEAKDVLKNMKTKIFAQTNRKLPEWVAVLREFRNIKCGTFLFVAWIMGFGMGLIFSFLFWHLQDYGGSPTLFGVASVINHISEIFAYFFSFRLIQQLGHVKVLCLGLVGNILRFLYISWLTNPWWVLPFEFIQGITHAAVWAACCSYLAHNTPQHLRASSQGVLQGIHHGLGRGCGAIIGGIFVNYFGTKVTFRGYGLFCMLVLAIFIFVNFYRKDEGFVTDLPQAEDPRQLAEESTQLAPHGVPANPIPRALSNTKLNEMSDQQQQQQQQGYGTYQGGENLGIPGGGGTTNPFLSEGGGGGGGGGGGYGGGYNYDILPDTNPFKPSNPFYADMQDHHFKSAANTSPDAKPDFDFIRKNFKAYDEAIDGLYLRDEKLKTAVPDTSLETPQPLSVDHPHTYDW